MLLGGVPYLLWLAAGAPWPQHVSSLNELVDRLAAPLTDPLLVQLLTLVGWVCWVAFVCSVIREVAWYASHLPQLLRDRNVHHEHLTSLSVRGSLAALCIGTLVVAVLGLWRPQVVVASAPPPPGQARPQAVAAAPLTVSSVANAVSPQARSGSRGRRPAESGQAENVRVPRTEYVVVEGDTLWDIARVHLGDPLKWPQIYALNRERVQEDGARLRDPDVIRPGWRLALWSGGRPPSDTLAGPVPETPAVPLARNEPARQPDQRPVPTARSPIIAHVASKPRPMERAGTRRAGTRLGPAAVDVGEASLIGITAAAGLLAARRCWAVYRDRRRGREDLTPPAPLSSVVDKAVQAAREAALPPESEGLAARRVPPQRPRSADTVTIGIRDGVEVDFEELAAPGGCVWTGPGAEGAARALLVGVLTAAERRRPGAPRVTAVLPGALADRLLPGLPAQFTALTQFCDTEHAVEAAEQHLIAHARAQEEREFFPATTLPGAEEPVHGTGPEHLLLLTPPDPCTGRLQALARQCRPGALTVLVLSGRFPGAASWHVAADGTATPGEPKQDVGGLRLFHLTEQAGSDVTDMLVAAHGLHPRPRVARPPARESSLVRSEAAAEPEREVDAGAPDRQLAVGLVRPVQNKLVRLHVLGPITLTVRGQADPVGTNLRGEVHEFLALLAAHPGGLLASDIADKLRLDPDADQNALKNLRRAVRRALRAATGFTGQEFVLRHGEFHKLHPDLVETDLEEFTRGLKVAFAEAGPSGLRNGEVEGVREVLAHYRGPFAQGGDYLWADTVREHLATQATDAALRLASHVERAGVPADREVVLVVLERLSQIHPDHERLVQHAIRLYQAVGRHDAARHAYSRLQRHLAELGIEPEPATRALVASRTGTGPRR
ncbi:BTAD domain-containing putative transcriptional regulator [Streptomyces sp. SL13]|uniref:BTAD domain-containing putative transcriptional regulator n=1 Tax=Streptantibioticus silvisoli TaxID=2705255 RepID=A0AA90KJ17_9ACTN|nr:BTAD domain-containing putative transcriptional regulator [Streptantibioticus silvisoli]MDI5974025.1 BTAD domain-containing putative transcriptional regulator [Streptantibioticus silvisoli]